MNAAECSTLLLGRMLLPFWDFFFVAFSALLPLINPLGSALVFLGLVGVAPPVVYRSLARRIAVNTIIFLAVIELLGSTLLHFFGISLPIVQVSGGLVIASLGWSLLNEKDAQASTRDKQEELSTSAEVGTRDLEQKTFYPFTFPVTAGPGTLVVMLTLSAHATNPVLTSNVLGHLGIFLAAIVLSVMVYLCYAYAPKITTTISPSTAHGILRVIAFILLCIGVQIAWNGLAVLLASVIRR
jgi:multiple antibiotic resistance protein